MKKLYVDYEKCQSCPECIGKCRYPYHKDNNGIKYLHELISFEFVCRRCEDHPCVNACVYNALQRKNDVIVRSKFRCVSCKSCAMACPFGTIFYDSIPYIVSNCDFCIENLQAEQLPLCAKDCPEGAIKYVDEEEIKNEKYLERFGQYLIVKVFNWLKFQGIKK